MAFTAKCICYRTQEYQLNLMPLQSINNNKVYTCSYFCSYALTSDMEMHVNILFADDFSFFSTLVDGSCSLFFLLLLSRALRPFQARTLFVSKACKCASFCMFKDHVCVLLQEFMCSFHVVSAL